MKFKKFIIKDSLDNKLMKNTAIVIGRFVIPHNGHLELFEKAYDLVKDKIFIGVVMGEKTKNEIRNFTSFIERRTMLDDVLKNIPNKIVEIKSGWIGELVPSVRADSYEPIAIVTGSDRVDKYTQQIHIYKDELGLDMQVIGMERDEFSPSGKKVRKALASNNQAEFDKMTPEDIHKYYNGLRKSYMRRS